MLKSSQRQGSNLQIHTLMLFTAILAIVVSPVKADKVDDFVFTEMSKRNIPGLQIAIIRQNKITKIASYRSANIEDDVPVTKRSVMRVMIELL